MYLRVAAIVYLMLINTLELKSDEVDDYVKLIKDHYEEVSKYERKINNEKYFPAEDATPIDYGYYDYVIIGAGSAGAIVAKRLADHGKQILLIEAGKPATKVTDIPAVLRSLLHTDYNWGYLSEPQKYGCQGMIDKRCVIHRGKSLGGSGTINDMFYVRGNSLDQSLWSSDGSIPGWSYEDVLPYFKRWENYSRIEVDSNYHGLSGPISIDFARPSHILVRSFIAANRQQLGLDYMEDYNGQYQMGVAKMQYFNKNGKRVSTGNTYLRGSVKNLSILTDSLVYKILFSKQKNGVSKATGVEFFNNKKRYRAYAKKEVVLSASTINNAQLLMLSGIGPKDHLAKHKIDLVQDLPVGQYIEDHVNYAGMTFTSDLTIINPNVSLDQHVWEFLSGVGLLSTSPGQSLSFYSVTGNKTFPDIEVILDVSGRPLFPPRNIKNYTPENLQVMIDVPQEKIDNIFNVGIVLLHPKSRGTVKLKSNSIKDFPVVDSNIFSNPDDIEVIYKAILQVLDLLKSDAFKEINVQLIKQVLPACKELEYMSKEYWICSIKQLTTMTSHAIGSCRMGTKGSGVVDNKLRVYGVNGLRVADLSVVPSQNSGHTNGIALMIGEMAADIILRK